MLGPRQHANHGRYYAPCGRSRPDGLTTIVQDVDERATGPAELYGDPAHEPRESCNGSPSLSPGPEARFDSSAHVVDFKGYTATSSSDRIIDFRALSLVCVRRRESLEQGCHRVLSDGSTGTTLRGLSRPKFTVQVPRGIYSGSGIADSLSSCAILHYAVKIAP